LKPLTVFPKSPRNDRISPHFSFVKIREQKDPLGHGTTSFHLPERERKLGLWYADVEAEKV